MESKMIVKIEKLNEEGKGIVYIDNNLIEIEGALPNDEIEIIITKKLRDRYLAKIHRFIKESEERENHCKLSGICGGCDFVNYVYEKQKRYKENQIKELFKDYEDKVENIVSSYPFNYRNKTIYCLTSNSKGNVIGGYYKKNSHEIVNIKNCPLDNLEASDVLESIKDIINELKITIYNPLTNTGSLRYLFTRINERGHIMLGIISVKRSFQKKKELINEIIKRNKNVKTIIFNYNDQEGNAILGKEEEVVYHDGFIIDKLKDKKIKISLSSFYQVNAEMVENLYNVVINESKLKKYDNVLDAYCGTGTIGLLVAKHVNHVTGVEINEKAIKDAIFNKTVNHQDNITFVAEDASKFILKCVKDKKQYSLVIMDPPRSGSSKVFIESLLALLPKKITYVSCNPITLKRDLELLKEAYEVTRIIPVDMFPHTKHVEVVVTLSLK